MITLDNQTILQISNIAIEAGTIAMGYYKSDITIDKKDDNSPIFTPASISTFFLSKSKEMFW